MQCGPLLNFGASCPVELQPRDVSGDGFSDRELKARFVLLDLEAMLISELLRRFIANRRILEVIRNAEGRYAITFVAGVSSR